MLEYNEKKKKKQPTILFMEFTLIDVLSGLENAMDRGAWQATVHGIPRVRHDLALSFFVSSQWREEPLRIPSGKVKVLSNKILHLHFTIYLIQNAKLLFKLSNSEKFFCCHFHFHFSDY